MIKFVETSRTSLRWRRYFGNDSRNFPKTNLCTNTMILGPDVVRVSERSYD